MSKDEAINLSRYADLSEKSRKLQTIKNYYHEKQIVAQIIIGDVKIEKLLIYEE